MHIFIWYDMMWYNMIWYDIACKNIIRIIYWLEHAKGISEAPHHKCQVNAGLCCSQSWAILLTDACGGHALVWGVLQTSLSTNSRTGSQLLSSLISFFGTWNILSHAIERPEWLRVRRWFRHLQGAFCALWHGFMHFSILMLWLAWQVWGLWHWA